MCGSNNDSMPIRPCPDGFLLPICDDVSCVCGVWCVCVQSYRDNYKHATRKVVIFKIVIATSENDYHPKSHIISYVRYELLQKQFK